MLDIDSYRTLSIDGMMFFMNPSACQDYFLDDFESGKYEENFVESRNFVNRLLSVENMKIVEHDFSTLSGQPVICI